MHFRRFVSNKTLFAELVAHAKSLPKTVEAMGGNAPVMANRFVEEGLDVLLGASLTQRVRNALNQEIKSI